MGNKRRRKEKKRKRDDSDSAAICSGGDTKDTTTHNINVDIETDDNNTITSPPIWTAEFVENIQKSIHTNNDDNLPSINDIGLQIVRGTLEKLTSKRYKKARKNKKTNETLSSVNATPIQLRLWPALLTSFQSTTSPINLVGIAPTGSGKTQSYSIPIISKCVHTLFQSTKQQQSKQNHSTNVHGLVLVPTRELAIQVAKELHLAAKVANKYMSKCYTKSSLKVDSLAIYGGADIDTQINTLLGNDDQSSSNQTSSLVVAATAGRLLDILKQTEKNVAEIAFSYLQAIVYDEADRIAINVDMANQVDEILSILKSVRSKNSSDIVSCLVSATLPDKAKDVCLRWVTKPRVVIKVNSVKVGEKKKQATEQQVGTEKTKRSEDNSEDGTGSDTDAKILQSEEQDKKKRNTPSSLDLSSIPSNIVQTLHVCSAHKKPKKLILTLQRIYMKKDVKSRGERFSANNRLTIVFFGQIKTVKYMSKLLIKEGLRCVELYGSLQQADREKRLLEFKAGKTPILLATDISARGIHISNVNYVVNYDFPGSLDQYVHRCGRAGRRQSLSGEVSKYPPTVYSFFTREFKAMADSVIELLQTCNAWVDPNLLELSKEHKPASKSGKRKRKSKDKDTRDTKESVVNDKKKKGNDESEDDNDQFAFLGRCVLKRADVSDASEDSDDD